MNITFGGSGRCGVSENPYPAAIIHYEGASGGLPEDPGTTPIDHQCLDLLDLRPVVPRAVSISGFAPSLNNTLEVQLKTNHKWTVNNSSQVVDWGAPVVQHLLNNENTWPGITSENVWKVDDSGEASEIPRKIATDCYQMY